MSVRQSWRTPKSACTLLVFSLYISTGSSFLLSPFTHCFGLAAISKVLNPACTPQQVDVGAATSFTFHTEDGRVVVINLASDPVYRCSRFSNPDLTSVNRHDANPMYGKDGIEAVGETQSNKNSVDKLYLRWRGSYGGDGIKFSQMIESPFLPRKGSIPLPPMYPLPEDLINKDGIVGLAAFLSVYDFELVTDFRKMGGFTINGVDYSREGYDAVFVKKITLRLRGGSTQTNHSVNSSVEISLSSLPKGEIADEEASSNEVVRLKGEKGEKKLSRVASKALDGGRPLRIALLTWESLHTIAVGGVAPHVTELAAGLERRGHEVHVYSRTGDGQMPYEIIDGVHIHRVPIQLDPDFITECSNMCNSFVWFLTESEQFQGAPFDICHGHDWLAAKAVVQCKNIGRNTVATIHSTEFGRCGNVNYGGQSERIRRIEEEVVQVADRVISVSGVLCDEVKQQFRVSEDKMRMVYNGIHLAPYLATFDAGAVKARYNIGPLDPLVLFVGRLATQKGPDLLVEAVPLVLNTRSDVKFAIVGDGYMRADLERRVNELGVSNAVRFLGSMSGRPLVELFKSTDCVCIPSRNEPFGIVVLEAWASGKPVVATSSGGPREFVDHGVDGYHVHPSANSISWGICEIFSNFENARQMGLRGRQKAQKRFNWDRIAQDTERIYRELAGF